MKLSEYNFILKELKKIGYGIETMTVKDAQDMADRFLGNQVKAWHINKKY